eukprot:IDg17757t1
MSIIDRPGPALGAQAMHRLYLELYNGSCLDNVGHQRSPLVTPLVSAQRVRRRVCGCAQSAAKRPQLLMNRHDVLVQILRVCKARA